MSSDFVRQAQHAARQLANIANIAAAHKPRKPTERGCFDPDCWEPERHPEQGEGGIPVVCIDCPKRDAK